VLLKRTEVASLFILNF